MKSPLHSRYSRTAYFHLLVACSLLAISACPTDAAAPTVSNVRSSQRSGTQLVDIDYDLTDPDNATRAVTVAVSTNGGASYALPATSFTGALGAGGAELAGVDFFTFQQALQERRICTYTLDDLNQEVAVLNELFPENPIPQPKG